MHVHFCAHCNRPFKERQLLSKLLLLRRLSLITKKCIIHLTNNINYHRNVPYNITSQAIRGTKFTQLPKQQVHGSLSVLEHRVQFANFYTYHISKRNYALPHTTITYFGPVQTRSSRKNS